MKKARTKNKRHIENARIALAEYAKRDDVPGIHREHVIDILADLMHFCDKHQLDFAGHLASAEDHYLEER